VSPKENFYSDIVSCLLGYWEHCKSAALMDKLPLVAVWKNIICAVMECVLLGYNTV